MKNIHGAGLGLRREMLKSLLPILPKEVDFWEVAPENWIPFGGKFEERFEQCVSQAPFSTHGLSLSIGSLDKLDVEFVKSVKTFLDKHNIALYSEHLSYCSDDGHLYDLMPIPFTEEAVDYVVKRIHQVQDILERPMGIENVSYYAAPGQEMAEIEFLTQVLNRADCGLLLDVNNIYVNSVNHGYDAQQFLKRMPGERVMYMHVAGHYNEAEDLIVDTHGADVIDPVWKLLETSYQAFGVKPTLLERDFNIPSVEHLLKEVDIIAQLQQKYQHQVEHQAEQRA